MNRRVAATLVVASLVASLAGSSSALAQRPGPTPAEAADPRPIPPPSPPGGGAPLSTSGVDVAPSGPLVPTGPAVPAAGDAASDGARRREIDTRLAIAEARLKTLEDDLGPLRNLKVQGYVQLQYLFQSYNAAASPNLINGVLPPGISPNDVIAKPDGTTTNANMFRLRRTRLRSIYETDVLRVFLQIDVLPAGGPTATQGTIARNAEATGIAHWTKDLKTEFTGGLFQVPFLAEVLEQSMYRPFIERTYASQSMFPFERDLGVHAKTIYGSDRIALDVGILNGQRLGETTFVLEPDLNGAKDYFAMATMSAGPVAANLSGYLGRGQIVDPTKIRVKNYDRLGGNIGASFAKTFTETLGETKVIGELMFGTNMDTGILNAFAVPTIPVDFSADVKNLHERAFYLRGEQELTKWGIAGFRYENYTTDSSLENNARNTYTAMAGLRFTKLLRLINEASWAIDNLHPEGATSPSKHVFTYTTWLQGSFY